MDKKTLYIIIVGIILIILFKNYNQQTLKDDNTKNISLENVYNTDKLKGILPLHDLACFPDKKYYCSIAGCEVEVATVYNLIEYSINNDQVFISRCGGGSPCDTYEMIKSVSGDYINFVPANINGMMFKIQSTDGQIDYYEDATIGLGSFMSYGHCKIIK